MQKTQRELVAAHFEATVPRWEEYYANHSSQSVYATIYRSRLAVALSLADGLRLPPGSSCLDVGCGPGVATVALAQCGFIVNAIDLVKTQLDRTQQRADEAGLGERVLTSVGDIHNLDFPEGVFDLIVVIGIMEWLEDLTKPLGEIARVLKPGGHVVLSVDNKWALHSLLDPLWTPPLAPLRRCIGTFLKWAGLRRHSPRTYSYSVRHFDRLAANAGLEKVEGITVGFGPFSFFGLELSQPLGQTLHRWFQCLADQRFPLLQSAGLVYVTIARRPPMSKSMATRPSLAPSII